MRHTESVGVMVMTLALCLDVNPTSSGHLWYYDVGSSGGWISGGFKCSGEKRENCLRLAPLSRAPVSKYIKVVPDAGGCDTALTL
ncbi:hypothetical protein EMIT0324P_220004 [Pseudomonas chlororaphis]